MKAIQKALKIMEAEFKGAESEESYTTSQKVKDYCRLQLGNELDEVFAVMFMDSRNRLLTFEKLFRGTVNEANVFLRPIVRRVLETNASKVILTHNHPSGDCTPSASDIAITKTFADFLVQINCQVLDHIIVSAKGTLSLIEEGKI